MVDHIIINMGDDSDLDTGLAILSVMILIEVSSFLKNSLLSNNLFLMIIFIFYTYVYFISPIF